MNQNWYLGDEGDRTNALLAAGGYNVRRLLPGCLLTIVVDIGCERIKLLKITIVQDEPAKVEI